MGYNFSYFAKKPSDMADIATRMSKEQVENTSFDEIRDSDVFAFLGSNGWAVCVDMGGKMPFNADDYASKESVDCEIIIAFVSETVMFQSAAMWRDGKCVWEIIHNSELGMRHLKTKGDLPDCFKTILEETTAEADEDPDADDEDFGTDYFADIPLLVASNFIGWKHDESPSVAGVKLV